MHALVKTAPMAALLAVLGAVAVLRSPRLPDDTASEARSTDGTTAPPPGPRSCPSGLAALASASPCVPLPVAGDAARAARERFAARETPPSELRREASTSRVGRLPERAAELDRYQLPVDTTEPSTVHEAPGRTHLALRGTAGAPVSLVELEGQRGKAEVVAVGSLRGLTVVTRHRTERDGRERSYLVMHARLARPGPQVTAGSSLGPLALVGFLDASGIFELDVRELLDATAVMPTTLTGLEGASLGFSVDPRNLLPLRP
ncbi:MAG: hypothetical protein FJ095_12890 [Deltaproteobacteria bacterium]|nr:hypothetical protein [Deltaproteobacteria bacterium]